MPLALGLTGGIASGKSLVGEYFRQHGVTVIDADQVSREVVEPGSEGLDALVEHFGQDILSPEGTMDRRQMRERVFADPEAREELEGILHPLIRRRLLELRDDALKRDGENGYCILMIPLLVKFGWVDLVDRLLVVDCSEQTQLSRLVARDYLDETLARRMLAAQETRQQRLDAATDIVVNEGHADDLQLPVDSLHESYKRLASGEIASLEPLKF